MTHTQEAKFLGVPIFSETKDFCSPDKIVLPLGYGIIYYGGVKCPVKKGENLVVPVTSYVSSTAPDDTIKVSVTAKDSKTKHQIFCVNVDVEIGSSWATRYRKGLSACCCVGCSGHGWASPRRLPVVR